jgi:hypothetical protein
MARTVRSNAEALIRRMERRPRAVRLQLEGVARSFAPRFLAENKKLLTTHVYNVKIPKRPKSKKPQWRREGGLRRAERARADGVAIVMSNGMVYAASRFRLGTPDGRPIRSEGVQSIQWHHEAFAALRDDLLQARRQAVLRGLISP